MAEKLLQYYRYVSEEKGVKGKMELAQLTKIASTRAAMEADTPENLAAFKLAVQRVTGKPAPTF